MATNIGTEIFYNLPHFTHVVDLEDYQYIGSLLISAAVPFCAIIGLIITMFLITCCSCRRKKSDWGGLLIFFAFATIAPAGFILQRNDVLSDYNKNVSTELEYLNGVIKSTRWEVSKAHAIVSNHIQPNLGYLVDLANAEKGNTTHLHLLSSLVKQVGRVENNMKDLGDELPRITNGRLNAEELRYTWTQTVTYVMIISVMLALGLCRAGLCRLPLMLLMIFVFSACLAFYVVLGMMAADTCLANQEKNSVNKSFGYVIGMIVFVNAVQVDFAEFNKLVKEAKMYPNELLNPLTTSVSEDLKSLRVGLYRISDELYRSSVRDTFMSLHNTICDATEPLAFILVMLLFLAILFTFMHTVSKSKKVVEEPKVLALAETK